MSYGSILGQTPQIDLSDYVTTSELNSRNFATQSWVSSQNFATQSYVDSAISNVPKGNIPVVIKNLYGTGSTTQLDVGPFDSVPQLILTYIGALESAMWDPDGNYARLVFGKLTGGTSVNSDWRFSYNGINDNTSRIVGTGSGVIGNLIQTNGKYYIRCLKSAFMGDSFFNDRFNNYLFIAFF